MAMTSEDKRLAEQARAVQLIEAVRAVADQIKSVVLDPQAEAANALAAGLFSVATAFRAEAAGLDGIKIQGRVTMIKNLLSAATLVEEFGRDLGKMEPPSPPPAPPGDLVSTSATAVVGTIPPRTDGDAMTAYLSGKTDVLPEGSPAEVEIPFTKISENPFGTDDDAFAALALPELGKVTPDASLPPLVDAGDAVERMSWPDFIEAGRIFSAARSGSDGEAHLSPSGIMSFPECPAKYLLSRSAQRDSLGRSIEMPAWWNVGGTAFHAVVERIERADSPPTDPTSLTLGLLWTDAFVKAERDAIEASGWPSAMFRTAKRGLENRDWWRVSGEDMVRAYVRYHSPERRARHVTYRVGGTDVIEWAFDRALYTVPTGDNTVVHIHGQIDRATQDAETGLVTVRDYKSGAKIPLDTIQLGIYAEALSGSMSGSGFPIAGAYWNARAGSHDGELADARTRHPLAEIEYRAASTLTAIRANAFAPRVSTMPGGCTSCEFKRVCPAVTL